MSNVGQNWNPYWIPPTPDVTGDDVYNLSCEDGAVSTKNPSQFLRWKKEKGLPKGTSEGDLLYWDPSAGDGGAWVIMGAPQNAETPIYRAFDVCENGQPRTFYIPAMRETQ